MRGGDAAINLSLGDPNVKVSWQLRFQRPVAGEALTPPYMRDMITGQIDHRPRKDYMARYVLLRCESNDSADKIIQKFAPLKHVNVVGLFVACSKFCECGKPEGQRVIRSQRWGTSHCSICKKPMKSLMQRPRNMLQAEDLPTKFVDFFISVWEPFTNDPVGTYGEDSIHRTQVMTDASGEKVQRHKRRKTRERRRKDGG